MSTARFVALHATAVCVVGMRLKYQMLLPMKLKAEHKTGSAANSSSVHGMNASEVANLSDDSALNLSDNSALNLSDGNALKLNDLNSLFIGEQTEYLDDDNEIANEGRPLAQQPLAAPPASSSWSFLEKVAEMRRTRTVTITQPIEFAGIAFSVVCFVAWCQFVLFHWKRKRDIEMMQASLDSSLDTHDHLLKKLKKLQKKDAALVSAGKLEGLAGKALRSYLSFLGQLKEVRHVSPGLKKTVIQFCAMWMDIFQQMGADGSEVDWMVKHTNYHVRQKLVGTLQKQETFSAMVDIIQETPMMAKARENGGIDGRSDFTNNLLEAGAQVKDEILKPWWIQDEEDLPGHGEDPVFLKAVNEHALFSFHLMHHLIVIGNVEHLFVLVGIPVGIVLAFFLHRGGHIVVGVLVDFCIVCLVLLLMSLHSIIMSDLLQGRIAYVQQLNTRLRSIKENEKRSLPEDLLRYQMLPSLNLLAVIQPALATTFKDAKDNRVSAVHAILLALDEVFGEDHGYQRWLGGEASFSEIHGVAVLSQYNWLNTLISWQIRKTLNPLESFEETTKIQPTKSSKSSGTMHSIGTGNEELGIHGSSEKIVQSRVFIHVEVSPELRGMQQKILSRAQVVVARVGKKVYTSTRRAEGNNALSLCIWTPSDLQVETLELDVYAKKDAAPTGFTGQGTYIRGPDGEHEQMLLAGRLTVDVGCGMDKTYTLIEWLKKVENEKTSHYFVREAASMNLKIHCGQTLTGLHNLMFNMGKTSAFSKYQRAP